MNVCARNTGWGAAAALAVGVGVAMAGSYTAEGASQTAASTGGGTLSAAAKRGEYLVTAIGCADCHTPHKMGAQGPEPEQSRRFSGHPADIKVPPPPAPSGPWIASMTGMGTAWAGPWGISYSANLTPDKETGLGEWTAEQFVQTIRSGRHQGRGRQILPPMPWPAFRNFSDEDLRAVFAYLQTIPAVKNKVPDPIIAAAPSQP